MGYGNRFRQIKMKPLKIGFPCRRCCWGFSFVAFLLFDYSLHFTSRNPPKSSSAVQEFSRWVEQLMLWIFGRGGLLSHQRGIQPLVKFFEAKKVQSQVVNKIGKGPFVGRASTKHLNHEKRDRSHPNLAHDCIKAGPKKRFDFEVLLEFLEKQLDVPALSVKSLNFNCWKFRTVCDELKPAACFDIVPLDKSIIRLPTVLCGLWLQFYEVVAPSTLFVLSKYWGGARNLDLKVQAL